MNKSVGPKGFVYVAVMLVLFGGTILYDSAGSSVEAANICKCEFPYLSNVAGLYTNCFVTNLSSDNVTVKFRLEGTTPGDRSAHAALFTGSGVAVATSTFTAIDANTNWNIRFTQGINLYPVIGVNSTNIVNSTYLSTITGNRYSGTLQFRKSNTNTLTCGSHFGSATAESSSGDIKITCVQTRGITQDTKRDIPVYCTTLDSSTAF